MGQKRIKTHSYHFRWADEPGEMNKDNLGLLDSSYAVYDSLPAQKRFEERLAQWMKKREKAKKKHKNPPPRPKLQEIKLGSEPNWEAMATITACARISNDTFSLKMLVVFVDFFETELSVEITHRPLDSIGKGEAQEIHGVNLGIASAATIERRRSLISNLVSNIAGEANQRIGQLLERNGSG